MTERQTLRALTFGHLARPDPLAWLAAADLLEGRKDDLAARVWRVRGEVFPALLSVYSGLRSARMPPPTPAFAAGAFTPTDLTASRLRAAVRVTRELLDDAGALPVQGMQGALDARHRRTVEVRIRPGWELALSYNAGGTSFHYDARVRGARVESGWWALTHPPEARQTTQRIVRLIDAMRCAEDAPRMSLDDAAGFDAEDDDA